MKKPFHRIKRPKFVNAAGRRFFPTLLALTGIMIATIAATMGQQQGYQMAMLSLPPAAKAEVEGLKTRQATIQELINKSQAKLQELDNNNAPEQQIEELRKKLTDAQLQNTTVQQQIDQHVIGYVRPGHQFTQWDALVMAKSSMPVICVPTTDRSAKCP